MNDEQFARVKRIREKMEPLIRSALEDGVGVVVVLHDGDEGVALRFGHMDLMAYVHIDGSLDADD